MTSSLFATGVVKIVCEASLVSPRFVTGSVSLGHRYVGDYDIRDVPPGAISSKFWQNWARRKERLVEGRWSFAANFSLSYPA